MKLLLLGVLSFIPYVCYSLVMSLPHHAQIGDANGGFILAVNIAIAVCFLFSIRALYRAFRAEQNESLKATVGIILSGLHLFFLLTLGIFTYVDLS